MNIVDLISFKGKIAFLERKGYRTYPLTYHELKERILKTETYLKINKVRKGDRILIQAPNSIDYVILMLACLRSGVIVVPLDIHTSERLRKKIIKETSPKLVFTNLNILENLTKKLPLNKATPKTSKNDIAEIIYTSGTTGTPKGVVLTHQNIYTTVKALKKAFGFKLRSISVLPLSHMLEQCCGLFLPLSNNSTILYPNSSRYSDLIDLIRYKRINIMIAVPGILEGLKKAIELREESLIKLLGWQFRIVGVGGASLPKDLEDWWGKRVLLLQGYGLTETSPLISTNIPLQKRKYSLGKLLKNMEIRIKDNEIQVKGPNIMQGYYKNPQKTKEVFDNGWFKTGDLGEIKNGFLYFRGRKKDIIVTKAGLNVYPQDIEQELNKYVKESCIIEKNNNIHAVLITEENPKKIIEEVNKKLEEHQKIASWSAWEGKFPKTPTGKIKRFEVSKKVEQPIFKPKNPLHTLLASSLKTRIKDNVPLTSLGMDSLKRMEIIALTEEQYGIELDERDITEKTTPKDIENLIKTGKKISYYNFKLPKLNFVGKIMGSLIIRFFCRIHCKKTNFQGLIISNHTSAFDTPVLASCIKTKYAVTALPKFFLGTYNKNIKEKLIAFFVRHFSSAYPFGPEVGLESSLRFTAHLLDNGFSIIIFPEGRMTRDGKIDSFKEGAGLLATNLDAEILPVKTEGLFKILPYNKILPKSGEVIVKTGKLFKIGKTSYFKATKLIEKKVKLL